MWGGLQSAGGFSLTVAIFDEPVGLTSIRLLHLEDCLTNSNLLTFLVGNFLEDPSCTQTYGK